MTRAKDERVSFIVKTKHNVLTETPREARAHTGVGLKIERSHLEELHRVCESGARVWTWGWVCFECFSVVKESCPERVEVSNTQSHVSLAEMRAWLKHLRTHGWTEADLDSRWKMRASGHERWTSWETPRRAG